MYLINIPKFLEIFKVLLLPSPETPQIPRPVKNVSLLHLFECRNPSFSVCHSSIVLPRYYYFFKEFYTCLFRYFYVLALPGLFIRTGQLGRRRVHFTWYIGSKVSETKICRNRAHLLPLNRRAHDGKGAEGNVLVWLKEESKGGVRQLSLHPSSASLCCSSTWNEPISIEKQK